MASVLGRDIVTASLRATPSGKREKVLVSLARVVLSQSLELHEMDLEFLRVSQLNLEKVEEFVLRRRFPHSVEDLLPFVEKSFNIIILELELVQVSNVQEVKVLLALLKPLEKEDKYLSSFKLRSMLVHPFLFKNCHSTRQNFRAYLFESDRKFDVQTVEAFGIVEHLIVGISLYLSNPCEGTVRVTRRC